MGEAITFVSSKGGTGKTIIAASFAYALRMSARSVVIVDTDFATRGMSLFLLANAIDSETVSLTPENCLADMILGGRDPATIEPRTIYRDGTTYDVVFTNSDVYEGGAPEDRVLGLGDQSMQASAYRHYIGRLLAILRGRYDYVVVDTRGGIDVTSVVPATESDGFVVVLEADQLSLDQVHGLLAKIWPMGPNSPRGGALKGFIVNKAVFSPEDRVIGRTLTRLYRGGRTLGIVPSDDDAIRAYQREEVPLYGMPGSAFSHYCLQAFAELLDVRGRWPSDDADRFEELRKRSVTLFAAETRASTLVARLPYIHLIVLIAAIVSYIAYRIDVSSSPTASYSSLGIAIVFSLLTAAAGVLRALRRHAATRGVQIAARGTLAAVIVAALYLLIVDVPRMFSREPLLNRLQEVETARDAIETSYLKCLSDVGLLNHELSAIRSRFQTTQHERDVLRETLSDSRRTVVASQAARDEFANKLDAAQRDLLRVTRDRDNLLRHCGTDAPPTSSPEKGD